MYAGKNYAYDGRMNHFIALSSQNFHDSICFYFVDILNIIFYLF